MKPSGKIKSIPVHSKLLSVPPRPRPSKNRISFAKENVMFPFCETIALCAYLQVFSRPADSGCLL